APIEIPPAARGEAATTPRPEATVQPGDAESGTDDAVPATGRDEGTSEATQTAAGAPAERAAAPYPAQIPLDPAPGETSAASGGLPVSWTLIALILLALGGAVSA